MNVEAISWALNPAPVPVGRSWDQVIVLVCHEGFQSSPGSRDLAATCLRNATELDAGFAPWTQAGPLDHAEVVPL